jgi:glucose-6-phosphate 1-epimerase
VTSPRPEGAVPLPPSVRLAPGDGGLTRVLVQAPAGSAEITLHGAHVVRWRPTGHDDVLFLSEHSRFTPTAAIRGGVPVCFPWFGPKADAPQAPAHGFARVSPWTLEAAEETGDDVVVVLSLTDSDATRASAWPHPFRATLRVTVGARLGLALEVHNTGSAPVTFEEALHTYLAVADARQARVTGLEGAAYLDKLGGPEPVPASGEPVRFTGETDRIYLTPGHAGGAGGTGSTTVVDPAGGRQVTVAAEDSATTVVWNPWVDKAAALADLGDDEWTRLVCVETCNVGPAAVTLAPGAAHRMTATIGVSHGP